MGPIFWLTLIHKENLSLVWPSRDTTIQVNMKILDTCWLGITTTSKIPRHKADVISSQIQGEWYTLYIR